MIGLVSLFFSACSGPRASRQRIRADLVLSDFTKGEITIYREEKQGRIYLADRKFKIVLGNKEFVLFTNKEGKAKINIPDELTTKIDEIIITVEGQTIKLPYRKRKEITELKCQVLPQFYFSMELHCKVSVKREKWSLGPQKEFEKRVIPAEGEAEIISPPPERNLVFHSEIATLSINRSYLMELLSGKRLRLKYRGMEAELSIPLPPLDHKVGFSSTKFTATNFTGRLENRTLYKVKVSVRAGYKRKGKWYVNSFPGIKHYGEKEFVLLPGEAKQVMIYFPPLLFSDAKRITK